MAIHQLRQQCGTKLCPQHPIGLPALFLRKTITPDATGFKLLCEAADAMRLSARGYTRVLRVARALADLDGADRLARAFSRGDRGSTR